MFAGMVKPFDGYCERLGPGLWEEPLNLAMALAVAVTALVVHGRVLRGTRMDGPGRVLVVFLVIGVLHHAFATYLSLTLALSALGLFVLVLLYRVNHDLVGLTFGQSVAVSAMFLPFAALALPIVALAPGPLAAAAYAPFPVLLIGMGVVLRQSQHPAGPHLMTSGLLLALAVGLRLADTPWCDAWPFGTHFLWSLASAAVLLRLLTVLARPALAARDEGR